MTDVIAALLPPLVVGGAFVAIAVSVKRYADREQQREAQADRESAAGSPGRTPDPGDTEK